MDEVFLLFKKHGTNFDTIIQELGVDAIDMAYVQNMYIEMIKSEATRTIKWLKTTNTFFTCLCLLSHDHIKRARFIEYLYKNHNAYHVGLAIENVYGMKRELLVVKCICKGKSKIDWSQRMVQKFIFLLCDYKYRKIGIDQELESVFDQEVEEKEVVQQENIKPDDVKEYIEQSIKQQKNQQPFMELFKPTDLITTTHNELLNQILKGLRNSPKK